MLRAVDAVETLSNYINGEFVEPSSGAYLDDINPATGEVCARIPASSEEDVNTAVAAAKAALHGVWGQTSAQERAMLLDRIADELATHLDEFAALETRDAGKTITMTTNVDIPRAVSNFRFFAGTLTVPLPVDFL